MFTDIEIATEVEDNELEDGSTYESITKTEKDEVTLVSAKKKKMKESF